MLLTEQFELSHELFLNKVVLKLLDALDFSRENRKSIVE